MKRRFRLVIFLLFLALPFTLFSCKSDSDSTINSIPSVIEPPTNLTAVKGSDSSIYLSWTASITGGVSYIVESYLSSDTVKPFKIDTTAKTNYLSTNLSFGYYRYKVWSYLPSSNQTSSTAAIVSFYLQQDGPKNFRANSRSDGHSIVFKWDPIDTTNNWDYTVLYGDGRGTLSIISSIGYTNSLDCYAILTGLDIETFYHFGVLAQNKLSGERTYMSQIDWAPAKRDTIKIYESNSTMGSGIKFSSTGPTLLGSSDYNSWDLGIDTRSSNFVIGTPSKLSYGGASGGKNTILYIHTQSSAVAGLDGIYDTEALNESTMIQGTIPITNAYATGYGYVIALKTADNHFAKVFVKAVGGTFLQGTAPNRYVECEVSYQTLVSAPYAL